MGVPSEARAFLGQSDDQPISPPPHSVSGSRGRVRDGSEPTMLASNDETSHMRYNRLGNTSMRVSHISLGGAGFSNLYGGCEEEHGLRVIRQSLRNGINYVETGPWYGQGISESLFGRALKDFPRSSFYIGSKVGRYEVNPAKMFDFSAEKTEFAVDNTLRLLGLDYVDVIQVHDLSFGDKSVVLNETLPALQKAVRDGKARFIGLADYDLELMKEVVEESKVPIDVVLSYAKSTLLDNRLQKYVKYFKRNGVGVINASATGMGLLTNNGPPEWHPATEEIKSICRAAGIHCAKRYVELARLATWFTINQPNIDTHICGFTNEFQLVDSINLMRKGLTPIEEQVYQHIKEKYFNGKENLHWDSLELRAHKDKLRLLQER